MAFKKGNQCKFYCVEYPTSAPTAWTDIDFGDPHQTISDLTISVSKDSETINIRTSTGWNATVAGNKSCTISFEMPYDPSDALAGVILAAFYGDKYVVAAALDGLLAAEGSNGPRAVYDITKCDRKESSSGVVSYSVEMALTYDAVLTPSWYTAPAA